MEGRLVLKDCSLFRSDGRVRTGMAVVIEGRSITAVGADAEHPVRPGDWEVRCAGRLVAPGLIDCETRLVTGQQVVWSGEYLQRSYAQRMEAEQRAGERLTVAEIEALTAFALATGLRRGVTMFVENLYAPACVEAGLAVQARAAHRLGARLVHGHASRSGDATSGPAQVEANARHVEAQRGDGLVRGSIGVRASSAADDELLRVAGRCKERLAVGAQFSLGEAADDLAITWERHGARVVSRLERFGLLGGGSVGGQARAIDRSEAARLAKTRTLVAMSPRVTQTLEGGSALGMEAVLLSNNLAGLGTGGTGTLWAELAASFSGVMALCRGGRMLDPDHAVAQFLVAGPAELCTMIYGVPSGSIDPGALADVVVYDYVPAVEPPMSTIHLLLQLSQVPVAWTVVDGRVAVREGQLVGTDFLELAAEAAQALRRVAHG